MKETTVNFKDKQGRNIVGTLLVPVGTGPFPAVVVCHGFKVHRNLPNLIAVAEELAKKNIASLRFDFTADTGESSLPLAEMTISYELEVLDEALKFVRNQKELDTNRIGLAGHSLGGLVIAWYAAAHPEVKSIATLSAVYDFLTMWKKHPIYGQGEIDKQMKEKGFALIYSQTFNKEVKINAAFYEDAQKYNMDKVIDTLACPILVIAGTGDNDVTLEHAQHYLDRSESQVKKLQIIKDSDHNYTKPENLEEVKAAVADWFAKTL